MMIRFIYGIFYKHVRKVIQSAKQGSPGIQPDASLLHCLGRLQLVEGEGNLSGRNLYAAPVCRTHRMHSKHARFDAQGRPRLSRLRRGSGNNGPINFHCSSVNSFCRFFMRETQHLIRLSGKYLSSLSLPILGIERLTVSSPWSWMHTLRPTPKALPRKIGSKLLSA